MTKSHWKRRRTPKTLSLIAGKRENSEMGFSFLFASRVTPFVSAFACAPRAACAMGAAPSRRGRKELACA